MTKPTVMGFHYTLKDKTGKQIDSSAGRDPLYVMLGRMHIVPGLDKRLPTLNEGDKQTFVLPPEEGYGEANPELRLKVAKSQFPPEANFKEGDQFKTSQDPNSPVFTVMKIDGEDVYIDGNHPLAGVELHFDVEVVEKREANDEEMAHGHAHGPGGHGH